MKRGLVAIGMLATVGIRPAWAQSAGDCVPSALNIPEAKYPCVYSESFRPTNTVTGSGSSRT